MHKTKVSLKKETDHASRKRVERKRYLNIIYFIDSKRTQTLKFSIGASYLTVGALAIAVVWSLVATGLLVRDRFVIAEMSSHSKSLLDTVFNYQTRYDEVYEKAYPNPIEAPEAIVEEQPEEAPQVAAKVPEPKDKGAKSANLEAVKSVLPINQAAIAKDKSNVEKPITELPIAIDNFASTLLGKSLTIRLSLKNLASPTKSSGLLTGTATFVDTNKETHIITGRATRSGDEDEHFNIRYFKNKNLVFEAPKDLAGTFASVKVFIKDDQGHSKEFPYTVNKEVPAMIATPVAAVKAEEKPVASAVSKVEEAPVVVKAADETAPTEEPTDAIDTSPSSGETETTNDVSN